MKKLLIITFILFLLIQQISGILITNAVSQYFFISSGDGFGIFLDENNNIKVLGKNNFGQIGPISTDKCIAEDGSSIDCVLKLTDLKLNLDSRIRSISAGMSHTLILTEDGNVYGLGSNTTGQLGDNTNISRNTIIKMIDVENAKAVSAGGNHSLILLKDGRVKAVGYNGSGQLGDGTQTDRGIAVFVQYNGKDLKDVVDIAAGNNHSLFLLNDGSVYSVGDNTYGQLGIGSNDSQMLVTKIPNLSNVKAISAGNNHSLFLMSDGTVKAVGGNWKGQLGIGNTDSTNTVVDIKNLSNVKAIAAGGSFSAFLIGDGSVKIVGNNQYGQFGNNTTVDSNIPVDMNIKNIIQITAGKDHIYCLSFDGNVYGVGNNLMGQLGDVDKGIKKLPTVINGLSVPTNINVNYDIPLRDILSNTIEKIETIDGSKLNDVLTIKRKNKQMKLEDLRKENTDFNDNSQSLIGDFQQGDILQTNDKAGVYFYFSTYSEVMMDNNSSLEFYNIDYDLLHYRQHKGNIWYKFNKVNNNQNNNDPNNNSNTGAKIDNINTDKLITNIDNSMIATVSGSTWYDMKKKTDTAMKYEVSTTNMLSIVKGTYFNVNILENGDERLDVIDGTVSVIDKRSNEEFTLNSGDAVILKAGSGNEIIKSDLNNSCVLFCDIPSGVWYKDYVKKLKDKGIIKGKTTFKYDPSSNVTRAEALKIALKIAGIDENNFTQPDKQFNDVSTNDWFYNFVYTAKSKGIIDGFNDGTFRPNEPVSRSQALKILIKANNIELKDKYNINFSDVKGDEWFINYLGWGVENSIINGYNDGTFKPNNNINRAEFAKIGSLMMDKLNK